MSERPSVTVVNEPAQTVQIVEDRQTVTLTEEIVSVVTVGIPGPPGSGFAAITAGSVIAGGTDDVPVEARDQYNISAFGAVPDSPATDNIPAINAAITAAHAGGGGDVFVPFGRWYVTPGPAVSARIIMRSGVTLRGAGPGAILTVTNDAGNYPCVIGAETDATYLEHVVIRDLAIDQNPDGNTTSTIAAGSASTSLFGIYFRNFRDVVVENVRFDPYVGVNGLQLNGSGYGARDARVAGCYFEFRRGASADTQYDTSAVYLNCVNSVVTGNRAYAEMVDKARGFIEIHAPLATVTSNTCEHFEAGLHIVSESGASEARDASNVTATGNTFLNVAQGISVQANPGRTLRNVTVSGNTIHIEQIEHDRSFFSGIYTAAGLATGNYRNISITNNTISFAYEADAGRAALSGGGGISEYASAGIGLGCASGASLRGFTVSRNIIEAAPYMGILLGAASGGSLSGGDIKDNVLINCGQNAGAVTPDYRSLMFAQAVVFDSVTVERNHAIDTGRANGTTAYGHRRWNFSSPAVGTTGLVVRDNDVRVQAGSLSQPSWSTRVRRDEANAALDFPSIAAGASADLTIALNGAAAGDTVACGPDSTLPAGLIPFAWVSAADTVTVRLFNVTGSAIDPTVRSWFVKLFKRQG